MNLSNFNPLKLQDKIKELEALIQTHTDTIASKENEIKDLQQTIAAFPNVKEAHENEIKTLNEAHTAAIAGKDKELTDLKASHEEAVNKFQEQLKATGESANRKAHSIVAALGVPAEEIKVVVDSTNTLTPQAAKAKLDSMPFGKERTEFYNQNKKLIWQA